MNWKSLKEMRMGLGVLQSEEHNIKNISNSYNVFDFVAIPRMDNNSHNSIK